MKVLPKFYEVTTLICSCSSKLLNKICVEPSVCSLHINDLKLHAQ